PRKRGAIARAERRSRDKAHRGALPPHVTRTKAGAYRLCRTPELWRGSPGSIVHSRPRSRGVARRGCIATACHPRESGGPSPVPTPGVVAGFAGVHRTFPTSEPWRGPPRVHRHRMSPPRKRGPIACAERRSRVAWLAESVAVVIP